MKRTNWMRIGVAFLLMAVAATAFARFTFLFRKVPNDWVRYEGGTFSMMMPAGFVRKELRNKDSALIRFVSAQMQIDVSEGWYAGGLYDPRPDWKNYQVEPIGVCSDKGKLVSYIDNSKSAYGKMYAAHVVCSTTGETSGRKNGLSVNTYSLTSEDRGWAVTALRSIRLTEASKDEKRREGTIDAR